MFRCRCSLFTVSLHCSLSFVHFSLFLCSLLMIDPYNFAIFWKRKITFICKLSFIYNFTKDYYSSKKFWGMFFRKYCCVKLLSQRSVSLMRGGWGEAGVLHHDGPWRGSVSWPPHLQQVSSLSLLGQDNTNTALLHYQQKSTTLSTFFDVIIFLWQKYFQCKWISTKYNDDH